MAISVTRQVAVIGRGIRSVATALAGFLALDYGINILEEFWEEFQLTEKTVGLLTPSEGVAPEVLLFMEWLKEHPEMIGLPSKYVTDSYMKERNSWGPKSRQIKNLKKDRLMIERQLTV